MEYFHAIWIFQFQSMMQKVSKQAVITIPLAFVVERDYEKMVTL